MECMLCKTQTIRLLDVVLIGPWMMWGGMRIEGPGGAGLVALGIATILYNGLNYLAEVRKNAQQ